MKVGDIIQYTGFEKDLTGIIIETGVYSGNNDILVMWQDGAIFPEKSEIMETLRETR
jgi:hypothetical protein